MFFYDFISLSNRLIKMVLPIAEFTKDSIFLRTRFRNKLLNVIILNSKLEDERRIRNEI